MKRTIVTLALVTAFVFAFAAVAMAAVTPSTAYMGFTPIRTAEEVAPFHPVDNPNGGKIQGFITFQEARAEMTRNGVPGALQNTAHGGYITTTSLCVVCHSAHRAPGVLATALEGGAAGTATANVAGTPEWRTAQQIADGVGVNRNLYNVQNQLFLTAGGSGCETCHVPGGSQASTLLVEWGAATGGGGPHASAGASVGGACVLCHNAGVHGLSGSQFNIMDVFMLGSTRNTSATTSTPAETRDEQIIREIYEGRILRAGTLDIPTDSDTFTRNPVAGAPVAGSTWWYDGARALGPMGGLPTGFTGAPNGNQYGAARSLATAFTCGESGCHDATAMFNLNWGMGFERVENLRDEDNAVPPAFNPTLPARAVLDRVGTTEVTGHVMPSLRATGGANGNACGPCHGGNPAGFPTASTVAGAPDLSRRAWGCDQCHDMVGVATNTTAWPHGNRNILVYEWTSAGNQIETTAAAGNLWMYGGNIARSIEATQTGNRPGGDNILANFMGPTSDNINFADQSWTVLTGVTSGRYGLPTGNPATTPPGAGLAGTGLTDGSCLKCHVPLDVASREALGSIGADAVAHSWRHAGSDALNPTWNGTAPSGSNRLFLYR